MSRRKTEPRSFAGAFVTRRDRDAVRHLMEVAGGLKSQIWGEDQILSQVKSAIAIARKAGAADPVLETLFRNAVAAGKAIKTQIHLTDVAVSAARAGCPGPQARSRQSAWAQRAGHWKW